MSRVKVLAFLLLVSVAIVADQSTARASRGDLCDGAPAECDCNEGAYDADAFCDFFPESCSFNCNSWGNACNDFCENQVQTHVESWDCIEDGYWCEAWCQCAISN